MPGNVPILETIADELDAAGDELFATAHQETALPRARLLVGRAGKNQRADAHVCLGYYVGAICLR